MDKYIESILNEHEELINETSHKIIRILKHNCKTLGQFKRKVDEVVKYLQYKGNNKHSFLINRIKESAQEEVNDLPFKYTKTTNKAVEALKRLSNGESTLNEIRIEFGLEPNNSKMANHKLTIKQSYKHEELD